jgi:hypothetical protein
MAHYCDSETMENNWMHWTISGATPVLEPYRRLGLLWTKLIQPVLTDQGRPRCRHGKSLFDPQWPLRHHCLALGRPIYFRTSDGTVKLVNDHLPDPATLDLMADLDTADPLIQQAVIVPKLKEAGYVLEVPNEQSWEALTADIGKICNGIALRFYLVNEDEQLELAQEAWAQVANKLRRGKLKYIPGRAPVFNLLTTTIYNVIFSILNRQKSHRNGLGRMLDMAQRGMLPNMRSYQMQNYAGNRLQHALN